MNNKILATLLVTLLVVMPSVGLAGARAKTIMKEGATLYPPNNGNVCVLTGAPPADVKYEVLARIVATKRTYGSVDELFLPMIQEARILGADAIINLQANHRFKGPLPWRITSPTGDGQAIKILPGSSDLDCAHVGGKLWSPSGQIVNNLAPGTGVESQVEPNPDNSDSKSDVPTGVKPERDLYEQLLQLDDLRQRGILSESEFQAEKKKLLERN